MVLFSHCCQRLISKIRFDARTFSELDSFNIFWLFYFFKLFPHSLITTTTGKKDHKKAKNFLTINEMKMEN